MCARSMVHLFLALSKLLKETINSGKALQLHSSESRPHKPLECLKSQCPVHVGSVSIGSKKKKPWES